MIRLIVFDLDLTLWHCGSALWCDQLYPPLYLSETGKVRSGCGSQIGLFPDVPCIIEELSSAEYMLAIASRTDAPDIANKLLDLLDIAHHFEVAPENGASGLLRY